MYDRHEVMEAIDSATENIKVAKEQLKRIDKVRMIFTDISSHNTFGFSCFIGDLSRLSDLEIRLNDVLVQSKSNLVKYKKMMKLLDKFDQLDE